MKSFLVVCVLGFSLFSCLKVQKKSDLEADNDQVQVQENKPVVHRLSGRISLTQDLEVIGDEVYFEAGVRLYTNQFALIVKSSHLYFDRDVIIQTFSEESKQADIELNGLEGGVINIKADQAHGNLQVRMNAQSGGVGFGGWTQYQPVNPHLPGARPRACNPNSGKNAGRAGSFFIEVDDSKDFYISTSMEIGQGGAIGPLFNESGYILDVKAYKNKFENCEVIPSRGQNGRPGQICMKLNATDSPTCEKY